jgi:hypothetical protein
MKLLSRLRHPVVLLSVLVLVLSLVREGDGFSATAVLGIVSKLMKVASKGAGNLAGHTWNVVAFKIVESGWNGLLEAIFPKNDKIGETMNEILGRFDQVESLVRRKTKSKLRNTSSRFFYYPGHDHHYAHHRSGVVEPDARL